MNTIFEYHLFARSSSWRRMNESPSSSLTSSPLVVTFMLKLCLTSLHCGDAAAAVRVGGPAVGRSPRSAWSGTAWSLKDPGTTDVNDWPVGAVGSGRRWLSGRQFHMLKDTLREYWSRCSEYHSKCTGQNQRRSTSFDEKDTPIAYLTRRLGLNWSLSMDKLERRGCPRTESLNRSI